MPNPVITRRWVFSMPSRVHPCLCGFTCGTYAQMKRHRRKCLDWQNRPDPRGLTIARRRESKRENAITRGNLPCPACGRLSEHHEADCPHSQGEAVRREALIKNGIDPELFAKFLRVLARKLYGVDYNG